ncbi:MAG TPA: hypothetical protein VGN77_05000 [Steroidobacteraceae bacterium]|nr:hypothetical protein [Steroidobacteraceae bacterium]
MANVPLTAPVWLVSPVHWVAGLDTVRVHPAGLLQLESDEQHALERDFQQVFAGSGWSLHATGRREMLLSGGPALNAAAVRSHDPVHWLGADPREGLPAGPEASVLRRLGTEMEMWLHEHPVNRARHARGALSASALWIWGGGAPLVGTVPIAEPIVAGAAVAWADDLFVDGLAKLEGLAREPLPQRWPSTPMDRSVRADVLAVCGLDGEPGEDAFRTLERHWIAPAFEQWRRGAVRSATLLIGAHAVTLAHSPYRSLWRRLGRIRPWWEILLQC